LKHQAFSTFLDQNLPFELRTKMEFCLRQGLVRQWPVRDSNAAHQLSRDVRTSTSKDQALCCCR
jgi:hypothetical protein